MLCTTTCNLRLPHFHDNVWGVVARAPSKKKPKSCMVSSSISCESHSPSPPSVGAALGTRLGSSSSPGGGTDDDSAWLLLRSLEEVGVLALLLRVRECRDSVSLLTTAEVFRSDALPLSSSTLGWG